MKRKQKKSHLKVIPGAGTNPQKNITAGLTRQPLHLLLLVLAFLLLAQILVGWVWVSISRSAIKTDLVSEGTYEKRINSSGLITFQERVVLAPMAGFVYYNVDTGERVPVGKNIASISEFPIEGQASESLDEKQRNTYFQQFKNWLFDTEDSDLENYAHLFPGREAVRLNSPHAGIVCLTIDGWEDYGPDSEFIYLTEEEFEQRVKEFQVMHSGKRVSRNMPVLRIIDNYSWYYSTLLPEEYGKRITENYTSTLYFDFEQDKPAKSQIIEVNQISGQNYEVTWRINRKVGDYYRQRWTEAEIVYNILEGILLPKEAFWEKEGTEGAFIIDHGRVQFQEVDVVAEKEEHYLVEGISPYDRVVLNPSRVREGQRFYQ